MKSGKKLKLKLKKKTFHRGISELSRSKEKRNFMKTFKLKSRTLESYDIICIFLSMNSLI